jgi:hypothetical protein
MIKPPHRSALQRQWQKNKSVEAVNRHHNHSVFIDWSMKSQFNPALCCAVCVTPKGKRAGRPQFIKWISDLELAVMQQLKVEERFTNNK